MGLELRGLGTQHRRAGARDCGILFDDGDQSVSAAITIEIPCEKCGVDAKNVVLALILVHVWESGCRKSRQLRCLRNCGPPCIGIGSFGVCETRRWKGGSARVGRRVDVRVPSVMLNIGQDRAFASHRIFVTKSISAESLSFNLYINQLQSEASTHATFSTGIDHCVASIFPTELNFGQVVVDFFEIVRRRAYTKIYVVIINLVAIDI